jgi:hypothetical protein
MTGALDYRRHEDSKRRRTPPIDEREIFEPWPDEDVEVFMTAFENGWRVPSPAHG